MSDPNGVLGVAAAVVASAGTAIQYAWRQQVEREKAEKAEKAAREKAERDELESRVKALEAKDHAKDLTLVRLEADTAHMRGAIDEIRSLVRGLAGVSGSLPDAGTNPRNPRIPRQP